MGMPEQQIVVEVEEAASKFNIFIPVIVAAITAVSAIVVAFIKVKLKANK